MVRPLVFALHLLLSAGAAAQEPPRAALMRTAAPADEAELAGALDRIARSALDRLGVVEVTGTLALDLEEAQLALGCMAENAECLGSVAGENGVQVLLAPRLDVVGEEYVLTLLRFDAETEAVSQADRRVLREGGSDGVLDSVAGMLRELFGLPEEPSAPPAEGAGAGDPPEDPGPTGPPADPGGVRAGGPILLGVGGAALIGGVVAGVLHLGAQSDYDDAPVVDAQTAMDAGELRDQAQRRGRAATALLIGGGLVAAAGLAWLIVDLVGGDDPEPSAARVTPTLAFGPGGVVAAGLGLEMDL